MFVRRPKFLFFDIAVNYAYIDRLILATPTIGVF